MLVLIVSLSYPIVSDLILSALLISAILSQTPSEKTARLVKSSIERSTPSPSGGGASVHILYDISFGPMFPLWIENHSAH